ncbi:glycosyl transferase, partial [Microbacterium maritypicum]
ASALAVCAVPALSALHMDRSVLTNGPDSTLPAYVAAQAAGDRPIATLVLTPQNDGGLAAEVAWGASETLGSQSTMLSTAVEPQGADISGLAVDLLSARDFDAPGELAQMGISYVLVAQVPGEGDKARTLRTAAVASIDQRAGLVHAGTTDRGVLWRLEAEVAAQSSMTSSQQGTARLVITLQLLAVFAALLLSIPTRASRRAARAQSRIVGRVADEPIVLPRHAEDRELLEDVPVGAIEDPQDEPALNDEAMAPIAEPVIDDAPAPSVEASSAIDEQHPKSTEEDR